MITELSPLLHRVATHVRPEDLLLQKASWVFFSNEWPDTWKWCRGKLFVVTEAPILVRYPASYILPESDYKKVDLSNATAGLKLYPEHEGVLYQCGVGFKPGDYITHIYVPSEKYVHHLGESSMFPDVTSSTLKYLGAKKPSDSPHTAPTLFLYFMKDGPAFYLWPYVLDSVTYEKCTFEFMVNKCRLEEIPKPAAEKPRELAEWEAMKAKALRVAYYTELVGY